MRPPGSRRVIWKEIDMSNGAVAGKEKKLAGIVGFFPDAESILAAMRQVKAANYQYFDAFTPYPVHGLERAQGLKSSPLPYVTFGAGLAGALLGFGFQYWTSAVDWPINVGGKPFNSWPAFIPITFELCVLFGALATVGAMFLLNGLPNTTRRIVDPAITRDKFAILIESPGPLDEDDESEVARRARHKAFDESEATDLLRKLGAQDIRNVYAEGWF
jgi:hypothetical protein